MTTQNTAALWDSFLDERRFMKNVTPATLAYYHGVQRVWLPLLPETVADLSKPTLLQGIKSQLEGGKLSAISINTYLRGLNAFLKWLHTEAYIPKPLKVPALKTEQKIKPVFSEEQVRTVFFHKPHEMWERRVQALAVLLLDTGLRINEALTLTRDNLNLDSLCVKVMGKGRKERIIPISPECRKVLWQWLRHQPHELVFATTNGTKLSHTNSSRDFRKLCRKLKIVGVGCGWHNLRHTFATHYIDRGGDVFRLQSSLGHSQLAVTQKYVSINVKMLASVHSQLSLVSAVGRKS